MGGKRPRAGGRLRRPSFTSRDWPGCWRGADCDDHARGDQPEIRGGVGSGVRRQEAGCVIGRDSEHACQGPREKGCQKGSTFQKSRCQKGNQKSQEITQPAAGRVVLSCRCGGWLALWALAIDTRRNQDTAGPVPCRTGCCPAHSPGGLARRDPQRRWAIVARSLCRTARRRAVLAIAAASGNGLRKVRGTPSRCPSAPRRTPMVRFQ